MGKCCCLSVREVLLLFSYLVPDFLPILTLRWLGRWVAQGQSPRCCSSPSRRAAGTQGRRCWRTPAHTRAGWPQLLAPPALYLESRDLTPDGSSGPSSQQEGRRYQLSFPFFRPRKTKLSWGLTCTQQDRAQVRYNFNATTDIPTHLQNTAFFSSTKQRNA